MRYLATAFFAVVYFWIVERLMLLSERLDPWVYADWLITYHDGGLKRRGLGGSVLIFLHDLFYIDIWNAITAIMLTLYALLFAAFLYLIWQKRISLFFVSLIVSPLCFEFLLNTSQGLGRKELVLLALFALFAIGESKNLKSKLWENAMAVLIFISTLLHELTFFFIPFFLLLTYLHRKEVSVSRAVKFILPSFIAVVYLYFFGSEVNMGQTKALYMARDTPVSMRGIFSWSNEYSIRGHVKFYKEGYILYPVALIIGIVHFFSFVKIELKPFWPKLLRVFLACLVITLPLYVLAIDWGRWIFTSFTLLLITIATLLPARGEKPSYSPIWKAVLILLILAQFVWAMSHVNVGVTFGRLINYLFL